MQTLDDKTDEELLKSLIAEVAKASNELRCSKQDVQKAQSRLSFVVMLVNEILQRTNTK